MNEKNKDVFGILFKIVLLSALAASVYFARRWTVEIGHDANAIPVNLGATGAIMIFVGVIFTGFLIHPNLGEQSRRIRALEEMKKRLSINQPWVVWGIPSETGKLVQFLLEDAKSKKNEIIDAIFYFAFSVFVTALGTYFVILGLYADFSDKKVEAQFSQQENLSRENKAQGLSQTELPPLPVRFYLPASLLSMQQRK